MADDFTWAKETLVYAGDRTTSKNKPGMMLFATDKDGNATGESMLFERGKTRGFHAIGGLYETEVGRLGERVSVKLSSAAFTGKTKDAAWCAQMQAEQTSSLDMLRRAKFEAKIASADNDADCIEPLRRAYAKCHTYQDRRLFQLYVLQLLEKPLA